ncbi:uncharacterized protein LOC103177861 [Callorhinchus milii]|uniref:uncharacterized protein LOC103177861 n=1 Tax=Callorhinchus milii TaxID=7868 RepID=UPI0004573575|nr:uncharacterized protein LOC103177861 [Callorhinchus milii]|eukprot:gi/632949907/ref/XP_007890418.1/ PREDICTED: uncharacterized protein LOC103177861 [Callorhinchus milii]
MSRSFKKKVTFKEQPVVCEKTAKREVASNLHSSVIESYFPFIVKKLSLSTPLYRSLKEKRVLTTDQIGQIELEGLAELKVAKLLEIVRNADSRVFKSFCNVLGEIGYWYLAQTLQAAIEEKECTSTGQLSVIKQEVLKEVFLLPKEVQKNLKEDNLKLQRKVEHMRKEYLQRIKELEEELACVSRERDTIVRACNMTTLENQALQKLNRELQRVIRKLESWRCNMSVKCPGYNVNMLPLWQSTTGQTSLLLTFCEGK